MEKLESLLLEREKYPRNFLKLDTRTKLKPYLGLLSEKDLVTKVNKITRSFPLLGVLKDIGYLNRSLGEESTSLDLEEFNLLCKEIKERLEREADNSSIEICFLKSGNWDSQLEIEMRLVGKKLETEKETCKRLRDTLERQKQKITNEITAVRRSKQKELKKEERAKEKQKLELESQLSVVKDLQTRIGSEDLEKEITRLTKTLEELEL